METFRFCAELDEKNRKQRCTRDGEITLFSGLMNCMDCSGIMRANIAKVMRKTGLKTYVGYCYGTNARCGKSVCSANMIRETAKQQKSDRVQLKSPQKRLAELALIISNLYEDKVLGKLSETVCYSMIGKYEQEQAEKKESLRILDGKLAELEKDAQDVDSFLAAIKKYVAVEQLDREMLLELIDHIDIGKSTGHAASKEKVRDIVVHYNFVGHIE